MPRARFPSMPPTGAFTWPPVSYPARGPMNSDTSMLSVFPITAISSNSSSVIRVIPLSSETRCVLKRYCLDFSTTRFSCSGFSTSGISILNWPPSGNRLFDVGRL